MNRPRNYIFVASPSFCSDCGAILPLLCNKGGVTCYMCRQKFPINVFGNTEVKYTIHFNAIDVYKKNIKEDARKDENEGPVVDRKCPKCENETMSYATLQLRSADEGQTVFYTCTRCKYKENENS